MNFLELLDGAGMALTGDFDNAGTLEIGSADGSFETIASIVAIDGALTNSGLIEIGNIGSAKPSQPILNNGWPTA